jgi:hypothetical protein
MSLFYMFYVQAWLAKQAEEADLDLAVARGLLTEDEKQSIVQLVRSE